MKNQIAREYRDRLDRLFAQTGDLSDDELKTHLAQYLCVRVSGFLQQSIRSILSEHAQAPTMGYEGRVSDYMEWERKEFVDVRLKAFQNPNAYNISVLIRSFDRNCAIRLHESLTPEMIAAITSVNTHRNRIAHGEDTILSFAQVKNYYEKIKETIALIEGIFNS